MIKKSIVLSVSVFVLIAVAMGFFVSSVKSADAHVVDPVAKHKIEKTKKNIKIKREINSHKRRVSHSKFLSQSVAKGEITEEQKDMIIDKLQETAAERKEIRKSSELSIDEKKEQLSEIHKNLKTWAEENGIDIKFIYKSRIHF